MPSIFECPFCKSRYNNWVSSVWAPKAETEISTYQCKECLNLFEHKILCGEEDETGEEWVIEM
jgi:transcription elongation factor Elf1